VEAVSAGDGGACATDDQLTAVHDGATPVYFRNRPAYYSWIAKGISGWTEASMSALRDLIREAQYQTNRVSRAGIG
jgi:hypothetical protein